MNYEEDRDDSCDLNPAKICDNCCRCIEVTQDYIEIPIAGIVTDVDKEIKTSPAFRSKPRPKRH